MGLYVMLIQMKTISTFLLLILFTKSESFFRNKNAKVNANMNATVNTKVNAIVNQKICVSNNTTRNKPPLLYMYFLILN